MAVEEAKTASVATPTGQTKPQEEKQTNCPACNKPLKKVRIYYRNGKHYCTKRCWRKATAPKEGVKQ
ncbi:MAG: hypothetical protein V2A59_02435 [Candidatus Omnitrophota bacterium]